MRRDLRAERSHPLLEENSMNQVLWKRPSAWLPIAMSLAGLSMVFIHLARVGNVHEPDEVAEAHIFQLLMVTEVPVVIFFAGKWLPRAPREALLVLALQGVAIIAAFAAVYWLT
jgi:hypothetical protein